MDTRFLIEQMTGVTVLFAVAGLAAWSLRKHSAASRHMVWWLALVAALVVPVASRYKPAGAPTVIVMPVATSVIVGPEAESAQAIGTAEILLAGWAVGFFLMFARLAMGVVRAHQRRRASTAAPIWLEREGVTVRFSGAISVPETFGSQRPVILLPVEAAEWSEDRLRVVLAHELTHVQRHDWLTQIVAQFSACVYWFHPLAWYALGQLRVERELACDDGVLRLGYRGSEYAQHLVDVARAVRTHTDALAASVPMATRSQLESRIRAILNPAKNRGSVTIMMKLSAMACTAIAIVLFSTANGTAANGAALSGTVVDPSGARVPKAMILVATADGSRKLASTTANDAGEFEVKSLQPGQFLLEVRKPGFRQGTQAFTIADGRATSLQVSLDLGSIQENVTVQGQGTPASAAGKVSSGNVAEPQRIKVGGNVQAAKIVRQVRPVYPEHLKTAGISGTVVLQAVIGAEGQVMNVESIDPDVHPDLVAAATDAVMQWQYQPTLLNGQPVEIITLINVNFTLLP
jgi:TonB family protein